MRPCKYRRQADNGGSPGGRAERKSGASMNEEIMQYTTKTLRLIHEERQNMLSQATRRKRFQAVRGVSSTSVSSKFATEACFLHCASLRRANVGPTAPLHGAKYQLSTPTTYPEQLGAIPDRLTARRTAHASCPARCPMGPLVANRLLTGRRSGGGRHVAQWL